jgi:hypothetical protein
LPFFINLRDSPHSLNDKFPSKEFFCSSLNLTSCFGYETGHFSQFQTQGVITCILKENKDRRDMSNWRPISLLNTDLKIASAAIANRFKQVLGGIISDTQKGFMKDIKRFFEIN